MIFIKHTYGVLHLTLDTHSLSENTYVFDNISFKHNSKSLYYTVNNIFWGKNYTFTIFKCLYF